MPDSIANIARRLAENAEAVCRSTGCGFRWECGDCYDGTEMMRERSAICCMVQ
jgi:hypothetical protein